MARLVAERVALEARVRAGSTKAESLKLVERVFEVERDRQHHEETFDPVGFHHRPPLYPPNRE